MEIKQEEEIISDETKNNISQILEESHILPIDQAFELLQRLATLLDELHESGIQHGLINPSSVIVSENKEVFLTNFFVYNFLKNGIGKEHGSCVALSDFCYFSPEQISEKRVIDESDIYLVVIVINLDYT